MTALSDDLIPLVQGGGAVGQGDQGLFCEAQLAHLCFPAVGGRQPQDGPRD